MKHLSGNALRPALTFLILSAPCWGQSNPAMQPIRYTIAFSQAHNHFADVTAEVPTSGRDSIELYMAVWTPGSYLVREYSRNLQDFGAEAAGSTLLWHRTGKNRWRVETENADTVTVSYRLYCREMSVRTNWVESDFAILNGAPTFLTLVGGGDRPHEVRLKLPARWQKSATGLESLEGAHNFRAADFDTLVDSPIVAGNPRIGEFKVDGKQHQLVNLGGDDQWDVDKAAADCKKIVEATRDLWGSLPYQRYVFLNVITETGGGLEHKNSTMMMTSRWSYRNPQRYRRWLGLVAHEYFHTWNVKRLRPVELGPFDYETEVSTSGLWIAEGFTSYYGPVILARAGLLTRKQYLEGLSRSIRGLQETPGRLVRSAATASEDAWIKHYRPDENSVNSTISYYTKGSIIGFLLDVRTRKATGERQSLDDIMRLAFRQYGGRSGYTASEFRAVVQEIAGVSTANWLERASLTTEELPYDEALDYFGLQFRDPFYKRPGDDEEDETRDPAAAAWLGLETRTNDGRLEVSSVPHGTPAAGSGFNVGDEIVAVDGYRVESDLAGRLKQYAAGETATFLVARRQQLREIAVTFTGDPGKRWRLQEVDEPTDDQKKRLEGWLN